MKDEKNENEEIEKGEKDLVLNDLPLEQVADDKATQEEEESPTASTDDFLQIDAGDFNGLLNEIEGQEDELLNFAISNELDTLDKSPDLNTEQDDNIQESTVNTSKKNTVPVTAKMAISSAKMYVATYELALAKICAVVADEKDDERFRFNTKDKVAYTQVSKEFFKTANIKLSPELMFFAFTIFMSFGSVFAAYKIKKEKNIRAGRMERLRLKEIERVKDREDKQMNLFPDEVANNKRDDEREAVTEEMKELMIDVLGRKKFDVDRTGMYIFDMQGERLNSPLRFQKAPPQIIAWKEEGLRNMQILKKIKKMDYATK